MHLYTTMHLFLRRKGILTLNGGHSFKYQKIRGKCKIPLQTKTTIAFTDSTKSYSSTESFENLNYFPVTADCQNLVMSLRSATNALLATVDCCMQSTRYDSKWCCAVPLGFLLRRIDDPLILSTCWVLAPVTGYTNCTYNYL